MPQRSETRTQERFIYGEANVVIAVGPRNSGKTWAGAERMSRLLEGRPNRLIVAPTLALGRRASEQLGYPRDGKVHIASSCGGLVGMRPDLVWLEEAEQMDAVLQQFCIERLRPKTSDGRPAWIVTTGFGPLGTMPFTTRLLRLCPEAELYGFEPVTTGAFDGRAVPRKKIVTVPVGGVV